MTTPFHTEADSFLGRADVVGLDSLFSAEEKAVALKVRGFVDEHIRPHIALFLVWAVYYFTYYGLQFVINDFKDARVSFTFNGVAELLGVYLSSHALKRYPKAPMLKWQLLIACAACLCFCVASTDSSLWSFLIFRALKSGQTRHRSLLPDAAGALA